LARDLSENRRGQCRGRGRGSEPPRHATDTDQIAAGANASAGYADGIAVFQFTEKGYMLQADISTKYWKDKKLNDR
jgi:hypothetical protein